MKTPREYMLALRGRSELAYIGMLVALYLVGFVNGYITKL